MKPKQNKSISHISDICSTYHLFNVIFKTTTYNFPNFLRLLVSVFHLCLYSALVLHFHGLYLQFYRNYVKEFFGSFKAPATVDLAVLKKIVNSKMAA